MIVYRETRWSKIGPGRERVIGNMGITRGHAAYTGMLSLRGKSYGDKRQCRKEPIQDEEGRKRENASM